MISVIYVIGHLVLAITAVPALGARVGNWYGPLIGLFIVAFGTGLLYVSEEKPLSLTASSQFLSSCCDTVNSKRLKICWGIYLTLASGGQFRWKVRLHCVFHQFCIAQGRGVVNWILKKIENDFYFFTIGGIRPCLSAFGGDQFKKEDKAKSQRFFSIYYTVINAGSLLAFVFTPSFKGNSWPNKAG